MLSIKGMINPAGIIRHLDANLRTQSSAMEKLSSGLRINTAADDPAGLAISEQLRSQIAGLERAIQNAGDADNAMHVTDGALGMIQGVLTSMRKLAVAAANSGVVSPEQIAGLQAEMDSSLASIARIVDTTNLAGRKILEQLQDEGKLNFGVNARKPEQTGAASSAGEPEGSEDAAGPEPPGAAATPGAEASLAEQILGLDEKDRALYDVGDRLKNIGMASLGSVTVAGEGWRPVTLTLDDLYSGGAASLAKDPAMAMRIVERAGRDIATQRAEVGATLSLRANDRAALEAQLENLTRMESGIRDADFATTMTEYARSLLLSQAGFQMLDAVKRQNESVLELLA